MDDMRNARHWTGVLLIAVVLAACVPEPTNRVPAGSSGPTPTPTATPDPTPAGPTPTPSFVRPTPTPQPTFFSYTVALRRQPRRDRQAVQDVGAEHRLLEPRDLSVARPRIRLVPAGLPEGRLGPPLIPNAEVDPENLPTLPPGG